VRVIGDNRVSAGRGQLREKRGDREHNALMLLYPDEVAGAAFYGI